MASKSVGLQRIAVDPTDTAADVARKFGERVDPGRPQFFSNAVLVPLRTSHAPAASASAEWPIGVGDWLTYTADDGSSVPAVVRRVHHGDDADHWDFTVALQGRSRRTIQAIESRLSERPAPRALPRDALLADCGVKCSAILCLGPPLGRGGTWTRELTFRQVSALRPRRSSLVLPLLHPRRRRVSGGATVARCVMRFLPRLRRVALLHDRRSSICWIDVAEDATLTRCVIVRRSLLRNRDGATAVSRPPASGPSPHL